MLKVLSLGWLPGEASAQVRKAVPVSWAEALYGTEDIVGMADGLGSFGDVAGDIAGKAGSLWDRASSLLRGEEEPGEDVDIHPGHLLAAHRSMLFTSDRAGLLLSGCLASSLRLLFLGHSSLYGMLETVTEGGLNAALSMRGDEFDPLRVDLSVRAAALVSFWLSDEYADLRRHAGL